MYFRSNWKKKESKVDMWSVHSKGDEEGRQMSEKMAVMRKRVSCLYGSIVRVSIAHLPPSGRGRQPTFHFLISTHVDQSMMVRSRLVPLSEPIPIPGLGQSQPCKGVCVFAHFNKSVVVVVAVGSENRTPRNEPCVLCCAW